MMQIGGQHLQEWNDFIDYLKDKNIRSYLEIGAREGIALRYLAERLPIEEITVIDLPGAAWGKDCSEVKLRNNLEALEVKYNLYLGDSSDPDVASEVAKHAPFDLIFIDGDHSYDGVNADYELYGNMGRILAFHDINQQYNSRAFGPTRLWNELGHVSRTFIADGSRKGIGVINTEDQPPTQYN